MKDDEALPEAVRQYMSALGRKSAAKRTPEQQSAAGKARAKKLSKKRRIEIARMGAAARARNLAAKAQEVREVADAKPPKRSKE